MDSSYLPHKYKNIWRKQKEVFLHNPKEFSDLNIIFFNGRCKFFPMIEKLHKKEGEEFLKVYNNLKNLALDLENILPPEIPLLKKGTTGKKEFTRKEVALIFLLSFFDIIDVSQEKNRQTNNFRVYQLLRSSYSSSFEFARCFLNYLTIIGKWLSENNPILEEKISYIRDTKPFNEEIFKKETKLCEIEIHEKGSLFDRDDSYGVDFANMYIGGGALEGGCVQEEILFAVQPEAVISMFFMEVMDSDDAIRINNTIEYSKYTGYGYDFKFKESAIKMDDSKSIKKSKFIAIDASCEYSQKYNLINKDIIIRDIHKAYVGFNLINFEKEQENVEKTKEKTEKADKTEEKEKNEDNADKQDLAIKSEKKIATGNWGCGAFGGDHELKFLQQWVAASFVGIDKLYYYTFESKKMKFVIKELDKIKEKYSSANKLYLDLITKQLCEGEVIEILLEEKNEYNDNDDYLSILGIKKK